MSNLRVDELESLATGRTISVDDIDTDVRKELASPDKGAVMVARGAVAVDSIADLLDLPAGQRKEGLRYLVKGYHAGSDLGGGEFYWDSARAGENNGGTVLGGFVRVFSGAVDFTMYGAVGDGVSDSTSAILAALENHKSITISVGVYVMKAPMELDGHSIKSLAPPPEFWGDESNVARIVFSEVSGTAVVNRQTLSEITGVWFSQADWTTELDGFRPERPTYLTDCMFTEFNGMGAVLRASADTPSVSPYYTTFTRCLFQFNAKHGVAIVNGGNAITLTDCRSNWNGSPAKSVQPSSLGLWDGLYINGIDPDYPPSHTGVEPQGILVSGGDYSYNSRCGQNWVRAHDSVLIGGYIELNYATDLRIRAIYGCTVINPMAMTTPDIAAVHDPVNPATNLQLYPNHIIVRGRNYGDGTMPTGAGRWRELMPAFETAGSESAVSMYPTPTGSIVFGTNGPSSVTFEPALATKIGKVRIGESAFSVAYWSEGSFLGASSTDEGVHHLNMLNAGRYGTLQVANGGGQSLTDCFLGAPKNSATERSINAGGTVNTVGADYAEYEPNGGLVIPKGSIVGFNSEGVLTLNFDDAVRFGVKSTNPSFVGGDTWANSLPEPPTLRGQEDGEDDAHYQDAVREHATDLSNWKASLEELRGGVDRIAYSGKVPVNVYGAHPSDYVIPTKGADGEIVGVCVSEPTLIQYLKSVGRVNRVLDDGRAEVAVIVH